MYLDHLEVKMGMLVSSQLRCATSKSFCSWFFKIKFQYYPWSIVLYLYILIFCSESQHLLHYLSLQEHLLDSQDAGLLSTFHHTFGTMINMISLSNVEYCNLGRIWKYNYYLLWWWRLCCVYSCSGSVAVISQRVCKADGDR